MKQKLQLYSKRFEKLFKFSGFYAGQNLMVNLKRLRCLKSLL